MVKARDGQAGGVWQSGARAVKAGDGQGGGGGGSARRRKAWRGRTGRGSVVGLHELPDETHEVVPALWCCC